MVINIRNLSEEEKNKSQHDFIRDYCKSIEFSGFHMNVNGSDIFIDTSESSQIKMAGGLLEEILRNDLDAMTEYFPSGVAESMGITSGQFIQIAQAIGAHVRKVLKVKTEVQNNQANGEYETIGEIKSDIDSRMA